jgi:hypothetical protein
MSNELTQAIRSGPSELNLSDNIFFRRRSLSNPAIFAEFLQALRENTSIEKIVWRPRFSNNLSPEQRLDAYQIIGLMTSLRFIDIAAPLTEASPIGLACRCPSLERLKINTTMSLRYDSSSQESLVNAIRGSNLVEFECLFASHTEDSLDPLLLALTTCSDLHTCLITTRHPVSGNALEALVAAPSLRKLQFATVLPRELSWDFPFTAECMWAQIAETLATSRLQELRLVTGTVDANHVTSQVTAIAAGIKVNTQLRVLKLECTTGFSDEACRSIAEALEVNQVLQHVVVAGDEWRGSTFRLESEKAYQAFKSMLQMKENGMTLVVGEPVDEGVCKEQRVHYRDIVVQMMMHQVGRHELRKTHGRESWVRSMIRINGLEGADPLHSWAIHDDKDWELFKLECLMWLIRENPLVTKRSRERRKESLMFQVKSEELNKSRLHVSSTMRSSVPAPSQSDTGSMYFV